LRSKKLTVAALLAATFIWGSTFSLVKAALLGADALSFLGLRFAVALGSFALVYGALPRQAGLRELGPGGWLMGAAAGGALYGGFFFQTLGLRLTTAANSAFITGLCVIMVPFLLWAGGRPPERRHLAGALAAGLGLYWLTGADLAAAGLGDWLTLACAFFFALHIICLGSFGPKLDTHGFFFAQLLTASLLAVVCALIWGGPVVWSGSIFIALGVTGVLATSLAFFLQTWAQRRLEPARAAVWFLCEPLFALGFGMVLLGEFPAPLGYAGAALILFGVAASEMGGRFLNVLPAESRDAISAHPLTNQSAPAGESSGAMESTHAKA
jgi:drug/metabolite transporter (DMT)-like permease